MKEKRKDTLLNVAVIVVLISSLIAGLACFTNIFGDWADVVLIGVAMLLLSCMGICYLASSLGM